MIQLLKWWRPQVDSGISRSESCPGLSGQPLVNVTSHKRQPARAYSSQCKS